MKLTVLEDETRESLGIVCGRNLEECLAAAVKKAGRPLKILKDYPNGPVAIMDRRRKSWLAR
jgi:hypothetical protein